MTSGEQRENVATVVLFRFGENERMKRATLVKQALRPLRTYIVESDYLFLSTTSVSICVRGIKEKKLSI